VERVNLIFRAENKGLIRTKRKKGKGRKSKRKKNNTVHVGKG